MITSFRGDFAFLSNFATTPFVAHWYGDVVPEHESHAADFPSRWSSITQAFDQEGWMSVEHYFQAAKALNRDDAHRIRDALTARDAKKMGGKIERRPDIEVVKFDVMLRALRHKFSDPALAERLVATGDVRLVEGNTWDDRVWGSVWTTTTGRSGDGRWVGQNWLGRLLAIVRVECAARQALS